MLNSASELPPSAAAAAIGNGMTTVESVRVLSNMALMGCFVYMATGVTGSVEEGTEVEINVLSTKLAPVDRDIVE